MKSGIKKLSPMQELMKQMNIDETYTKPIKYRYPKVKDNIFPKKGYNYEADILLLPETSKGYSKLLVVVDLYSNNFDFQEMKSKTSEEVLDAFKKIFKRGIITKPLASIRTDSGGEFKSVVDQYMYDNNILHLWSLPDRHKQMANVENLNKQLGRIIMTYLQNKSAELHKEYFEWTDIINDQFRKDFNKIKKHPKDIDLNTYVPKDINLDNPPKYKVGDLVYRRLEIPVDEYGTKLHNGIFRQGDNKFTMVPTKIIRVLAYSSPNPWRYILQGFPNVSYAEAELLPSNESEEKFVVRKIIGKMTKNKIVYYLVWWKKELKKDATWEPKTNLLEDKLDDYIQQYEKEVKDKAKKKRSKT